MRYVTFDATELNDTEIRGFTWNDTVSFILKTGRFNTESISEKFPEKGRPERV